MNSTKEYFLKLAKYNEWANKQFIQKLNQLEDIILLTEVQSSFTNMLETCKHLWFAEAGWLSRMQNKGWQTIEVDHFQGKPNELFSSWQNTSQTYIKLIETQDLDKRIEFTHNEITYSVSRADIILTVINHGNYHRGQIVTMLRQLGIKDIPKTDYIEWIRLQARNQR